MRRRTVLPSLTFFAKEGYQDGRHPMHNSDTIALILSVFLSTNKDSKTGIVFYPGAFQSLYADWHN
tara:strand:- start:242 stop:439 length:198 start_codon:yes stop_codon:yes gene_type:complete